MFKQLHLVASLVVSAFLAAPPAFAWDDFGHMAVAAIAYKKLAPSTRARADQLIRLNPSHAVWIHYMPRHLGTEEKNMYAFMQAATWPDAIKGDATYQSDGLDSGYRPDGITSNVNVGYSDKLLHKYWHFVDLPISADGAKLPPVPTPNAETEMALCRATLASQAGDELKSYDLSWLLHLVGDVHQPLHCVTRVSKKMPYGDSGGNAVKIYDTDPPTLLHTFWDQVLGTERNPASVIPFIATLEPADAQLAADLNARNWIEESFSLCKSKVYVSPVKKGVDVKRLSPAYKKTAYDLSRVRVELAGERLANVLNAELK